MSHPIDEVRAAVDRYVALRARIEAGEARWPDLADLFTDDVVYIDPAKRGRALEAGALSVIDGNAADAARQLVAATGGGARMVLDLVGSRATVDLAIASATRGTEIVIVGLYGGELSVPIPFFPLRPLAIRGSYVGNLGELR